MDAIINYNPDSALYHLTKNSYLNKHANLQLLCIERGRILYLSSKYKEAIYWLNKADELSDTWKEIKVRTTNGSILYINSNRSATDTILNTGLGRTTSFYTTNFNLFKQPNQLKYRSEHYERMIIHYLKAICFMCLNDRDGAIVEAKRLLLLSHQLDDLKHGDIETKTYYPNPFPHYFAGLIFEWANELDDAKVAYEKARFISTLKGSNTVYGISTIHEINQALQ